MRKFIHFLSFTIFLFSYLGVFSQNSDEAIKDLNKRFPILMKTYGDKLQNLEVEYIVAIDLSKSMNKIVPGGTSSYFNEVKKGIIQFLNAIPDNSKISIVGFGNTVRMVQIPTVLNDANRIKISSVLTDLKADEDYTDLKGAVNLLIEGCSSSSTIKYLFTFTDFNNDPPAISPFSKVSWDELQRKYALISKNTLIEAFALKLPIDKESGQDLSSVRTVFPGLNVIEFDALSLQNWFSDRCGKLMEQNLWTFVSKDLLKIKLNAKYNLKARIGINGQIKITGKLDSLPNFVQGLNFIEPGNLKISGNNDFIFTSAEITQEKNSCQIGSIKFKSSSSLFSFNNEINGILTGKVLSSANEEIDKLYAVVSLNQNATSKNKENKTADEYLTYTQNIHASKGFVLTWPLWIFILAIIAILGLIYLLVFNSIFPYKLSRYALKINNDNFIKLDSYYKYVISTEKGDSSLNLPIELEFEIVGTKGDPFNLFFKKGLAMKILKGNPDVKIGTKFISKNRRYHIPCSTPISISEGITRISFEISKSYKY